MLLRNGSEEVSHLFTWLQGKVEWIADLSFDPPSGR